MFYVQLYCICFIRVLDGGHWIGVGCCNGLRYKKVENHWFSAIVSNEQQRQEQLV